MSISKTNGLASLLDHHRREMGCRRRFKNGAPWIRDHFRRLQLYRMEKLEGFLHYRKKLPDSADGNDLEELTDENIPPDFETA